MTLLPLVAGPLSMMFDTHNAFLRYVKLGDQEILRGVFAAVRDRDWNTLEFAIEDLQLEQSGDAFTLRFAARCLARERPFDWRGQLIGSSAGTVEYHFRGESRVPFLRNRIGLCVLHPANCAGVTCEVEHVDGSREPSGFPQWIAPHQPFKNVRAITHQILPQIDARVSMFGDTFETEDQRNWTDASFKTYSTPLELPFPVALEAGSVVEQSVKLELLGDCKALRPVVPRQSKPSRLDINWDESHPCPALGCMWHAALSQPNSALLFSLRQMQLDHLRIDVRLDAEEWMPTFDQALELASAIDARLEVALFVDDCRSLGWTDWLARLSESRAAIARVLLFHTIEKTPPESLLKLGLPALRQFADDLPIAVGTNAYFAELNRGRPTLGENVWVCYSINPQVHAGDNLSICETLAALPATVNTAVQVFSTDVVVSPVTLRPRFNPNATSQRNAAEERLSAIDPRQATGFAAAWTAGVFAALATHPHVRSLTLFEAWGPRGVMADDGSPFPLTSLMQWVARSTSLVAASSSDEGQIVGLGLQQRDRSRQVLIANLSDVERVVAMGAALDQREYVVAAESVLVVPWENAKSA